MINFTIHSAVIYDSTKDSYSLYLLDTMKPDSDSNIIDIRRGERGIDTIIYLVDPEEAKRVGNCEKIGIRYNQRDNFIIDSIKVSFPDSNDIYRIKANKLYRPRIMNISEELKCISNSTSNIIEEINIQEISIIQKVGNHLGLPKGITSMMETIETITPSNTIRSSLCDNCITKFIDVKLYDDKGQWGVFKLEVSATTTRLSIYHIKIIMSDGSILESDLDILRQNPEEVKSGTILLHMARMSK